MSLSKHRTQYRTKKKLKKRKGVSLEGAEK
jgi:hypothetical protein